jgi:hypothetical protein
MITAAIAMHLREWGLKAQLTKDDEIEVHRQAPTGLSGLIAITHDGKITAMFLPAGQFCWELADPNSIDELLCLCQICTNM